MSETIQIQLGIAKFPHSKRCRISVGEIIFIIYNANTNEICIITSSGEIATYYYEYFTIQWKKIHIAEINF